MSQVVPQDILTLAIGVNGNLPPPGFSSQSMPQPPPEPVDLKMIGFDEGDSVKQMRTIAQAVYQQLVAAYLRQGSDIPLLQRRYEQALDALRKLEAADRQARKEAGGLIPRIQVERDMAALAEMLRVMRESMSRRVLELCPTLNSDEKIAVGKAVERVRRHEERIFRRLDRYSTADELLSELNGELSGA